uniref:C2H2-type domain-containing protein n=2 Tax=Lepeophtheirus salmonis TaxID=72036 RepID=A0A0K2T3X1_LEPSM
MTKVDRFWSCDTCGLQSRDKTDMRRHVEARHIDTNGFPCDQCSYVSKTRYNLVKHVRRKHLIKGEDETSSSLTSFLP